MTKITDLNKASLTALRPEIDAALAELGARFGLTFRAGNGSYAGDHAHFKLEIKVDDPAVQEAAAKADFDLMAPLFGLEASDYNREFGAGSKRYRLIGFEPKRRKWPFRVMDLNANKVVLLGEIARAAIIAARPSA